MQEDSGNCKSTQPGWPVRPSQFRHHVLSISLHPVRRDAPCCGFITGEPRLPRVFADCSSYSGARPAGVSLRGVVQ